MRLTNQQRIDAIIFFNKNKFHGIKYKYFVVTAALKDINIHISAAGLRKAQYLWGGISRRGLTDLVIFEGKMNSAGFQDILTVGLIPFLENFLILF